MVSKLLFWWLQGNHLLKTVLFSNCQIAVFSTNNLFRTRRRKGSLYEQLIQKFEHESNGTGLYVYKLFGVHR